MMVNSARPRRSGAIALLRAAACLVVLLALAVGLPLVLWQATVTALPAGLDDLAHLFSRQETTGVLLLVLAAIGWVGWAGFLVSVAVEVPAQLRGRISPRLPGFRLGQRAAATLVGSILVLLPTGTAMASPAHTAAATATAHPHTAGPTTPARAHGEGQPSDGSHHSTSGSGEAGERSYTVRDVRPAESLWSIAEKELGDGTLWTAIAEANAGRTMPDGTVFRADGIVRPGWTLRLPAPRHAHSAHPQHDAARSVKVTTGQTLSGIAERELGDASRYMEIFETNRDEVQPGGHHFTDPNLLYPGQRLDLPTAHQPAPHHSTNSPHDNPHDEPRAPEPDRAGTPAPDRAHSPAGTPSATPAPHGRPSHHPGNETSARQDNQRQDRDDSAAAPPPAPHPSTTASPKPTARTPAPTTPTPSAPTTAQPSSHSSQSGVETWKLVGVGALLAAALAGALGIKRILQQRRRRAGETIAMPDEASAMEQALTAAAEPASVQLLDTALRTLHHQLLTAQAPLPALRGARVTGRTVDLLLDDPTAAPAAPFTQGPDGWWTLPQNAQLLDPDEARQVPAPWPGLATLGSTPDGDLLLVNLPHARTVLLEGEPAEVRTVVRAIAMEAATCGWTDRTEILTVGLGDELSTLLPQGRVRAVPHLRAATRDLGELLLEQHQADDSEAKPLPWLLICAAEATAEDAWDLADAVSTARDLPVALVLPAAHTAACFPEAELLDASNTSAQTCDMLASPVVLQRVENEDYARFVADLRVAEEPARPAQEPWHHVPGSASAEDLDEPGHFEQSVPYLSLAASAGPATVHLLPAAVPADEDEPPVPELTDPADSAPDNDSSAGGVITLVKEQPVATRPAPEPCDTGAPEIQVLGPVTVTGIAPSGHGAKLSSLAALIYFKPGRGAEALREAMDPKSPWSKGTLQARMSELRGRLGADADGDLYLPRDRSAGYRLSPAVRCDWERFQHLAEQGLALGADRGVDALEEALGLVRGRPFGAGDHAWAAPLLQEMLSRIVDVAHTIATWRRRTGPAQDLEAARRAITLGLDADDTAELLYQDWMLIEDARGNRAGVHHAIETLQNINRRLDVSMEPETENVIKVCLAGNGRAEVV
ncbi:hypothetical protein ACFY0Z_29360 [Streptomyces kronopolitis]|uniref:hypothetical protein n=1 Tax=Streptomyces kronopolitis TaxID=1612435 RepID=UPI00367A0FA1